MKLGGSIAPSNANAETKSHDGASVALEGKRVEHPRLWSARYRRSQLHDSVTLVMRIWHVRLALYFLAWLCQLWRTGATDADPDWFFEALPSIGGGKSICCLLQGVVCCTYMESDRRHVVQ